MSFRAASRLLLPTGPMMPHFKRLLGSVLAAAIALPLLAPATTTAQWYLPVAYDEECSWGANGCMYTWKANHGYGWLLEDCGGYIEEPQIIYEGFGDGYC